MVMLCASGDSDPPLRMVAFERITSAGAAQWLRCDRRRFPGRGPAGIGPPWHIPTSPRQTSTGAGPHRRRAIRYFLAGIPGEDTKAAVTALAERAVKEAATQVCYDESKKGQAQRRAKLDRMAEWARQTPSKNPVEVVLRVQHLAREVGGI